MDAKQWNGSDDRDELGRHPDACDECDGVPCICETHCARHRKPLLETPCGLASNCIECEPSDAQIEARRA